MNATDEPNYRLMIEIWPSDSSMDARYEYFPATAWDEAIDRARAIAASPERTRNVRVLDCVMREIARFSPYWIYRPTGYTDV